MRAMRNCLVVVMLSACPLAVVTLAQPPAEEKAKQSAFPREGKQDASEKAAPQLSLPAARERARLAHRFYSATLDAMHRSYFNSATAPVPARVMERMFADLEADENIKARWIAVNANAMSVDHEPETEFEKQAAQEIAAGKGTYERIENGVYQRAGAISLMNHGCLTCHLGFGKKNTKDRFAGLIISIPVKGAPVKAKTGSNGN